jgi:hypothetical protein
MWGLRAGNEQNAVEVRAIDRCFRHREVTDVDRVERSAENPPPQG